tara:strand:+ start:573 stop:869 length:297 start_codon:yes stop_codon:yes gene_type:complete
LAILHKNNVNINIIEYLKKPLEKADIKNIINMLGISAFDLIRKDEKVFKEKYKGRHFSEEEWISILCQHPILMQRPIVIKDSVAIIGRPPINVLALLK